MNEDPDDVDVEFAVDYEDRHIPLDPDAVNMLVVKHRDEYDRIFERLTFRRTLEMLEGRNEEQRREILRLRELNPDGVFVPALQQTLERLQVRSMQ